MKKKKTRKILHTTLAVIGRKSTCKMYLAVKQKKRDKNETFVTNKRLDFLFFYFMDVINANKHEDRPHWRAHIPCPPS